MGDATNILKHLRIGSAFLLLIAVMTLVADFWFADDMPKQLLLGLAVGLSFICLLMMAIGVVAGRRSTERQRIVMDFMEDDATPCICTDIDGKIRRLNVAAQMRFPAKLGQSVTQLFDPLFANPDGVVHRLKRAAEAVGGVAREDVVTRRGHVQISLHRMDEGFLWRLGELTPEVPQSADDIGLPALTFSSSGSVIQMNELLCALVGAKIERLDQLFERLPLSSGDINVLLTPEGKQSVRVFLSDPVDEHRNIFILPADDGRADEAALDALPVALLRFDPLGTVVYANRLARDLLPAFANGTEFRLPALVEGLGRSVREWVSEAAAGRGLYRAEVVRVTGAEVETYLQITLSRPIGSDATNLLAVLNDATELKTLEAQFVQSQKMQAIGQLAGGVAHDFNNLLTAISGHCDLLMLRHGEGDDDHADLTQITQNANRAAALVGQLLAFSRKQTLEMRPIDLRDALDDLAHLLNRLVGDRVTLRLQNDPALVPIRGDRRQLEQVLMNLVVNARDAMPTGGEILIATECQYLSKPLARDRVVVPPGQYVVISVKDCGTGISPDNLTRIFEPFFTTKRPGEGTGLGLSMAYGIVKQSGGYIFADSILNEGTRFSLYFPGLSIGALEGLAPHVSDREGSLSEAIFLEGEPLEPAAPISASSGTYRARTSERSASSPFGSSGVRPDLVDTGHICSTSLDGEDGSMLPGRSAQKHEGRPQDECVISKYDTSGNSPRQVVLLVEDEAPVRAFASRALRLRGYDVHEAENAEAALEQLADEDLVVDLFLTDVMMPGLDGPTWVRQAMQTRPNVRTIFISGYTQDAMSETSAPVPNSIFLPKPFSLADLTRTVEKALS